jgi:hypothetical protein
MHLQVIQPLLSLLLASLTSGALSCLAKAAQDASGSGLYHGIEDSTWDALTIDLAPNVAADLAAAFQIFKTQARLKKQAIIYFAAAAIALGGAELVGKINIPKVGFGVPTNDNDECKGLKVLGQESVSKLFPSIANSYLQLYSHSVQIQAVLVRLVACALL